MSTAITDWNRVAAALKEECPSPSLRAATAELLSTLQKIGPLRPAEDEFRRVYHSLHWNEPERVRRIVRVLEARTRGPKPQANVRAEAWDYTMAAFDEWVTHGRIFYIVTGIVEGTLRARIDARMTDYFGTPMWADKPKALPSFLQERWLRRARESQFKTLVGLVKGTGTGSLTLDQHEELLAKLRHAIQDPTPDPMPRGNAYLRQHVTLSDLINWFQGGRFWGEPFRMQDLFRGRNQKSPPPQFDKLKVVLSRIHLTRNDVAHYRPGDDLSFAEPLFAAATLTAWLDVDLQHIYSSIDIRSTTELSALLGPLGEEVGKWSTKPDHDLCIEHDCPIHPPLNWLLERAPRNRTELAEVVVRRACIAHRVRHWEQRHRRNP